MHGLTGLPAGIGLVVGSRPRSNRRRRSEGVEIAASAALAAKSLESAGYQRRRVVACIQTVASIVGLEHLVMSLTRAVVFSSIRQFRK